MRAAYESHLDWDEARKRNCANRNARRGQILFSTGWRAVAVTGEVFFEHFPEWELRPPITKTGSVQLFRPAPECQATLTQCKRTQARRLRIGQNWTVRSRGFVRTFG